MRNRRVIQVEVSKVRPVFGTDSVKYYVQFIEPNIWLMTEIGL